MAEESQRENLVKQLNERWGNSAQNSMTEHFAMDAVRENVQLAWLYNTQVNFCATAYPTVPAAHEDAAALTVLGGFLRNGYLHGAIREQGGAYGGGATQDSSSASFRFSPIETHAYLKPWMTLIGLLTGCMKTSMSKANWKKLF